MGEGAHDGVPTVTLAGRLAIVTGASAGIGAAVVRTLAAAGAHVAFCARESSGITRLTNELAAPDGPIVSGYVADMRDARQVSDFLDRVEADMGRADILINNVGQSPSRNFLRMDDDDWRALFELNLMSAVRCTRRVLPFMREQRWGRIVMVSTAAAKYPSAPLIDYSASKAAMIATAKALANRYGADNVLVNTVLPGLIDTPMWDRAATEIGAATDRDADAVKRAQARSVPLSRYGTPEEVANVVAFLCSDLASYVNGVALAIDGGQGPALL